MKEAVIILNETEFIVPQKVFDLLMMLSKERDYWKFLSYQVDVDEVIN